MDLRLDLRFMNEYRQMKLKINLCNNCLMVFEIGDLVEVKGRLLCKTTKDNKNKGFFEELNRSSSKEADLLWENSEQL